MYTHADTHRNTDVHDKTDTWTHPHTHKSTNCKKTRKAPKASNINCNPYTVYTLKHKTQNTKHKTQNTKSLSPTRSLAYTISTTQSYMIFEITKKVVKKAIAKVKRGSSQRSQRSSATLNSRTSTEMASLDSFCTNKKTQSGDGLVWVAMVAMVAACGGCGARFV